MARPVCCRRIGFVPDACYFKPAGIRLDQLEEITLNLDELEALRLADLGGLYQEQAASSMGISRPTFARIVEGARRKVAEALVGGKALRLEGGAVSFKGGDSMRRRKSLSRISEELEPGGGRRQAAKGERRGACEGGGRRRRGRVRDRKGDSRTGEAAPSESSEES